MIALSVTLGMGLVLAAVPVNPPASAAAPVQAQPKAAAPAQPVKPLTLQRPAAVPAAAAPKAPAPAASKSAAPKAPAPAANPTADKGAAAAQKPAPKAPAQAEELHPVEAGILARTNAERARFGLRPLVLDWGLLRSARRHAQWMSRNHTMQHTTAPVAENIAMGQNSSQEAVNSWMNSSGHRANILNSGYTRVGVAAYRTPQGTTFWCQQFMR